MKRVSWFVGLAAALMCGCVEKGSKSTGAAQFLHLHWAGAANIIRGTNAATLQQALKLPTTKEVRDQVFARLLRAPEELWKKSLPADAHEGAARLRPLLEDIWDYESIVEFQGNPSRPELILAAKVEPSRVDVWHTNLVQLASSWKLGDAPADKSAWKIGRKDFYIHFKNSGGWVFAALTPSAKNPFDEKAARGAPSFGDAVLELRADWQRLGQMLPVFSQYALPPTHLKVTPRGDALRTEGKLVYSDRLPIKLEPWKIPTNIISEPLISFTCGRGIRPLLDQIEGFSKLGLKNPPNQFCSWGLATVHAQTFLAVPMPNATNVIKEIAPRLPELVSAHFVRPAGQFLWASNRSQWMWTGLPMIIPHVHAARSGPDEYLFAGLFPSGPRSSNTPPAELFAQVIGRTNLVYYDWELTQERLPHARHMSQLIDIVHTRQLVPLKAPTQRWITELAPLLGNTITEVTLSGPKELSLTRKSNIGMTGHEIIMLTRWIDSPQFPFRYQPPPLPSSRTNRPAPPKQKS